MGKAQEEIKHRGMRFALPHPAAGEVLQVASPMRFANAPLEYRRAPPLLGENTREVLATIGYDDAKVEALKKRGIV